MKNNFKLLTLVISLASSLSINAMQHIATDKTVKIYTSKFNLPVGKVDFTNLYSALSKVPDNEKESVQNFFNDINSKAYLALSALTEKYASQIIDFESFNSEIKNIITLVYDSIKTFKEIKMSNVNLKNQILFEYQRVIIDIIRNFIATGTKINSVLSDDLHPKKKTIVKNYQLVTDMKSKL